MNINSFDKTGDGYLTPEEIKSSFHTAGVKLSMKQITQCLENVR